MRMFPPTLVACLALASWMVGGLIAAVAAPGGAPVRMPATVSAPLPAAVPRRAAPAAPGASVDNDAPARHARRTACLKDAKSKKLLGAQRAAYLKDCIGGP